MKLLFLILSCLTAGIASAQHRPNIVLIIGDDISPEDLGCYGNKRIRTPNLDRLAQEGLQFSRFFVTSSSCSPSRTSLLTGRYPHNTGAAELHTPLPAYLTYFPEVLKKEGYYTALLGKWHEGPETKRAYDLLKAGEKENGSGGEDQWLATLRNRPKDKPFFFWLAPFDAHRDWSADPSTRPHDPDKDVAVPETLVDAPGTREDLAAYYNEIGRLDHHLGDFMAELNRQGIADNTLVIFLADNARPFPGSKTRLTDRGLRSPLLMRWPKGIPKHGKTDALVSSIDLAPTLTALAGAPAPASFQGKSFAPLLTKPGGTFRRCVFGEHNWHDYEAWERSVRTGDFLYILNLRPDLDNGGPIDANQSPAAHDLKAAKAEHHLSDLQSDVFLKPRAKEEFYDLKKDPGQRRNLVLEEAYASKLREARLLLRNWQEETGDTAPANLTPDWYDRETGKPTAKKGQRGEMPGASRNAGKINRPGPF